MRESEREYIGFWVETEESPVTAEEEADLFRSIQDAIPGIRVGPWGTGGNGPIEVFNLVVGSMASATAVVAPVVAWLRKRFKKAPDARKRVAIYAPDGSTVLRTVYLDSEEAEPTIDDNPYARLEGDVPVEEP